MIDPALVAVLSSLAALARAIPDLSEMWKKWGDRAPTEEEAEAATSILQPESWETTEVEEQLRAVRASPYGRDPNWEDMNTRLLSQLVETMTKINGRIEAVSTPNSAINLKDRMDTIASLRADICREICVSVEIAPFLVVLDAVKSNWRRHECKKLCLAMGVDTERLGIH